MTKGHGTQAGSLRCTTYTVFLVTVFAVRVVSRPMGATARSTAAGWAGRTVPTWQNQDRRRSSSLRVTRSYDPRSQAFRNRNLARPSRRGRRPPPAALDSDRRLGTPRDLRVGEKANFREAPNLNAVSGQAVHCDHPWFQVPLPFAPSGGSAYAMILGAGERRRRNTTRTHWQTGLRFQVEDATNGYPDAVTRRLCQSESRCAFQVGAPGPGPDWPAWSPVFAVTPPPAVAPGECRGFPQRRRLGRMSRHEIPPGTAPRPVRSGSARCRRSRSAC